MSKTPSNSAWVAARRRGSRFYTRSHQSNLLTCASAEAQQEAEQQWIGIDRALQASDHQPVMIALR